MDQFYDVIFDYKAYAKLSDLQSIDAGFYHRSMLRRLAREKPTILLNISQRAVRESDHQLIRLAALLYLYDNDEIDDGAD